MLDRDIFRYIGCLDAIDGSTQAWSLPGGWSHVMVIQEYVKTDKVNRVPICEPRFVAVVDAEGGITSAEPPEIAPFVDMVMIGRPHGETVNDLLNSEPGTANWHSDYDNLTFDAEGDVFSVTGAPIVLMGGYKAKNWGQLVKVREAILSQWPEAPMLNAGGSPVARKVIQNADNVVIQPGASTLWDGAAAALVARAGGCVIRLGENKPKPADSVWAWWKEFGFQRRTDDPDRWEPSRPIPPFIAGMDSERVTRIAELCHDL